MQFWFVGLLKQWLYASGIIPTEALILLKRRSLSRMAKGFLNYVTMFAFLFEGAFWKITIQYTKDA